MSLREAIRLADATPGADRIVFDPAAFAGGFNRIDMERVSTLPTAAATTSNAFRITSGDGLTINGDFDGDGLADVEIFGGFLTINGVFSVTPHFEIASARITGGDPLLTTGTVATRLLSDFAADLAEDNDLTAEFDDGDTLEGGGGNDTLHGQKGNDTMKGGGGSDLFLFKPGDGDDVIRAFQHGRDVVEFQRGVPGFGALAIEQQGADVLVTYARGSILFENQNAGAFGAFGAEDFVF